LAFNVAALPPTASSRLPFPALATVLLKLIVADEGSAKMRSPDRFEIVKLSNVALWPVPFRNCSATPVAEIEPPPVAEIDAPLPCSATATACELVVVISSVPLAVIEPAAPPLAASLT
jgi:hypothetical protein